MEDVTERLKEMFKDENWAVLTATGEISQIHVRQYLEANWSKYTDGLGENEQLKALILCGVHGGIDGKVGGDARNVEDFTNMAVSFSFSVVNLFVILQVFLYLFHSAALGERKKKHFQSG